MKHKENYQDYFKFTVTQIIRERKTLIMQAISITIPKTFLFLLATSEKSITSVFVSQGMRQIME